MRTLAIGTRKYTQVNVTDEKSDGNANHRYEICPVVPPQQGEVSWCQPISFQKGPIKEAGVNGVMNEDLIAVVIDRMRGFQSGDFACRDNANALKHLEEALLWLNHRTEKREQRGVEGTHTV